MRCEYGRPLRGERVIGTRPFRSRKTISLIGAVRLGAQPRAESHRAALGGHEARRAHPRRQRRVRARRCHPPPAWSRAHRGDRGLVSPRSGSTHPVTALAPLPQPATRARPARIRGHAVVPSELARTELHAVLAPRRQVRRAIRGGVGAVAAALMIRERDTLRTRSSAPARGRARRLRSVVRRRRRRRGRNLARSHSVARSARSARSRRRRRAARALRRWLAGPAVARPGRNSASAAGQAEHDADHERRPCGHHARMHGG
ncbi:MAG: hypothetical protein JWP87_2799 [Labilithrix sp.]|nr:hypothetical protein [Labilithrix sp.]